jgi:hypothetical protein
VHSWLSPRGLTKNKGGFFQNQHPSPNLFPVKCRVAKELMKKRGSQECLHKACPKHTGGWYFSGEHPTPGGFRFANQAFLKFVQGENSPVHG